jgi:hypothetical protein
MNNITRVLSKFAPEPQKVEQGCRFCGSPAPFETLVMFGARCSRCYGNYVHESIRAPKVPLDAKAHSKAWAHNLKARLDAGERLSSVQRQMMADVLPKEQE